MGKPAGSRLPLRGMIRLRVGINSLWNLDWPRRSQRVGTTGVLRQPTTAAFSMGERADSVSD
jgi:hypothetical protein